MVTVKEIYNHCKTNNKPLLMDVNSLLNLYPSFPDSNANFLKDYQANYKKYDRVFTQKYMSKRPFFIDEKDTYPAIYNEWVETCTDFVADYLWSWAYLYHSLCDENNYWNPTHNYDGTSEIRTSGTMEGLSGSDSTSSTVGTSTVTNNIGAAHEKTKNHSVPYDSTEEKETDMNEFNSDAVVNSSTDSGRSDSNSITYGKKNDVDYTVKEVKGGNLGVSTVPGMISELAKLDSFWNTVFETLSKELTLWGGKL